MKENIWNINVLATSTDIFIRFLTKIEKFLRVARITPISPKDN